MQTIEIWQDTECANCPHELNRGDDAYYDKTTDQIYCLPCGTDIDDYIHRR